MGGVWRKLEISEFLDDGQARILNCVVGRWWCGLSPETMWPKEPKFLVMQSWTHFLVFWVCPNLLQIKNFQGIDFHGNIYYTSQSDWCEGLMFDSLEILDLKQIWADPEHWEMGPRLHHQEFGFFRSHCFGAQPTSPSSYYTIQNSGLAIIKKFRNFQFSSDPPHLRSHLERLPNSQFSIFPQDSEESRRSANHYSLIFLSLMSA
jgi:hypothetical protein